MAGETAEPEILRPGTPVGTADTAGPGEGAEAVLPQRLGRAGHVFRDENLDMLSKLLDTWFRVPGTNIRFGLDGIIGFIPGIGDLLSGLASCIIVVAAYARGVPVITVARMVANLGIEVVVGMVPVLGNLFDIGWRANRRNYALLERSIATGKRDTRRDWLFMGLLALLLITMAMLPFLLVLWLGGSLLHRMHAPGWR